MKRLLITGPVTGPVAGPVVGLIGLAALLAAGTSSAFEKLTEAQALVYDASHLANTTREQTIEYRYTSLAGDGKPIEDKASLTVVGMGEGDRRDVSLEFLSDERHLALPEFTDYRGNPIIIAMLEHLAQSFSADTGGGALYFRNRIRDAMAKKGLAPRQIDVTLDNDRQVQAESIEFDPFVGDAYLGARPEYAHAHFSIVLSDEVPGGVVSVSVESRDDSIEHFRHSLQIAS